MKIGILTYHRSHNYGALLQAIALRDVITRFGHDVRFIDYWPDYHRRVYSLFDSRQLKDIPSLSNKLKYVLTTAVIFPLKYLRFRKFNRFIDKYIKPYCGDVAEEWDIVVCGSDQIWRKQPGLSNQFNPVYFGAGDIKTAYYISYAASMGKIGINENDKSNLKELLSNLRYISVRESDLYNLVVSLGFSQVALVSDPTLLLSKKQWMRIAGIHNTVVKARYLLFYDFMSQSFKLSSVEKYAKQKGLKLVILKGRADYTSYCVNTITVVEPYEMIKLIANAEEILTSSYHGLVFSLIFNKPVACAFRHNSKRAESLLSILGIEKNIIPICANKIHIPPINYDNVNIKLNKLKKESIDWLSNAIME